MLNPTENYELKINFLQPWSIPVLQTTLPPHILNTMIELTDEVIADKKSASHNELLLGQIDTELTVSPKLLEKAGVINFLNNIVRHFVLTAKKQQFPKDKDNIFAEQIAISMVSMWIVSQQPNEYNPIHTHTNCNISSVMYLKVPKFAPDRKTRKDLYDGSISFISNTSSDINFSQPSIVMRPSVGDFFIFGAQQLHTVYPYRCEEGDPERRSVSFNANYELVLKA